MKKMMLMLRKINNFPKTNSTRLRASQVELVLTCSSESICLADLKFEDPFTVVALVFDFNKIFFYNDFSQVPAEEYFSEYSGSNPGTALP